MSETPVPQPETQAAETQAADAQMPKTQTVQLWPGMMVEVMTPENRLLYVGRVEKIQNGGVYIREANDDTLPMVVVNTPVKVRFYRESDNLVLQGKVCGSTTKIWKVDRLETTFAREKRGFFRQNISFDIEGQCGRLPSQGGPPKVYFPCHVLDISAGGMLISCAEPYAEGARLIIKKLFLVERAPEFVFKCRIRRAGEWKRGVTHYGCQFESLTPKEQDRLLQAIFTIQREEIRKRRAVY